MINQFRVLLLMCLRGRGVSKEMRIRTKIIALVGALSLIALTISGVGLYTMSTLNQGLKDAEAAAARALYSARLNQYVTGVVMDARGVYAAKDTKEAEQYAKGLTASLNQIDALFKEWAPLVPEEEKALFERIQKDAASFRTFRLETARLGTQVSPEAAAAQGFTQENRANRKVFQDGIDEITRISNDKVGVINAEIDAVYQHSVVLLAGLALGGLLGGIAIGGIIGHAQISRPLQGLVGAINRLASGDYQLPQTKARRDEIGEIWKAMHVFAKTMAEAEHLRQRQAETEQETMARRRTEMIALADRFEGSVGSLVQHVSAAAQELEATAQSMSATAEQAHQQSRTVASASDQTSANVQAVAAATEELAATAGEIGSQVSQSSRIASQAVTKARHTNERVGALAESAQRIGDVVSLITTVAGQTNLLALNATIEAARAGEAGKGFAVVASEVKELANQTARATEEISSHITRIQQDTREAVSAIQEIGHTIEEMHQIASSVAAAAEEQQAATQEIARSVSEAARGTQEVTGNISHVQAAATHAGAAATQVLSSAGELARNSSVLSQEVQAFLQTVRAA